MRKWDGAIYRHICQLQHNGMYSLSASSFQVSINAKQLLAATYIYHCISDEDISGSEAVSHCAQV
jgi:hypothetical protein